jgi:hypothetical protein
MNGNLENFIKRQLPAHIVDSYPTFVTFIEAYYEWLDQENKPNGVLFDYQKKLNVNLTIDLFVDHFLKEVGESISNTTAMDKRKLIKYLSDLYRAKGTEKSFKLLFKLLYNQEVSVSYPGDFVLRASYGKWIQKKVIRVVLLSGDGYAIKDSIILGKTSGTSAFSDTVQRYQIGANSIFEVSLNKNTHDGVFVNEIVEFRKGGQIIATGQIQLLPVSVTITNAGVGAIFTLQTRNFDSLSLLSFGALYNTDYNIDGYFADNYNGAPIQNLYSSPLQGTTPSNAIIQTRENLIGLSIPIGNGIGGIAEITNAYHNGGIKQIKIKEPGGSYSTTGTINLSLIGDGSATCVVNMDYVFEYPGYWLNADGKISDQPKLQDNLYYQDYSYIVKVGESINTWRNVVKKILHPSGMKMFGEADIRAIARHNISSGSVSSDISAIERFILLLVDNVTPVVINNFYEIRFYQFIYGLGNTYDTLERFKYTYSPFESGFKSTQNRFTDASTSLANTQIKDVANVPIKYFSSAQNVSRYGFNSYNYGSYGLSGNQTELDNISTYQGYKDSFPIKKSQKIGLDSYIKIET